MDPALIASEDLKARRKCYGIRMRRSFKRVVREKHAKYEVEQEF